jgi:hypothetical protein
MSPNGEVAFFVVRVQYLFGGYRPLMEAADRQSTPGQQDLGGSSSDGRGFNTCKPQRITITIAHSVHEALLRESDRQGRSLSNLASFWLEQQAGATRTGAEWQRR